MTQVRGKGEISEKITSNGRTQAGNEQTTLVKILYLIFFSVLKKILLYHYQVASLCKETDYLTALLQNYDFE